MDTVKGWFGKGSDEGYDLANKTQDFATDAPALQETAQARYEPVDEEDSDSTGQSDGAVDTAAG
ncbi:MAG TPA: hypothetical protein VI980_05470 [Acidimicrobiia bacterium]|nr:hypothetical protein [Acidimicrobiia bacterium]